MSEYPEALIEKVATAIRAAYADSVGDDIGDYDGGVAEWMGEAVAALDALGLREELSALYVNDLGKVASKDRARHRYVTEWEPSD